MLFISTKFPFRCLPPPSVSLSPFILSVTTHKNSDFFLAIPNHFCIFARLNILSLNRYIVGFVLSYHNQIVITITQDKWVLVREVNVRVLGKGLELLSANGGRFDINQLLFADDTALVAGSEDKLCRLVSEFGRVCERRKLRVNVGKSKVMRC